MNYGAEPADQVVRYSLEGMEYSLKITGNVAIFLAHRRRQYRKGLSTGQVHLHFRI